MNFGRPWLAITFLAALASGSPSSGDERSVAQLLEEALAQGEAVDPGLLDAIGRHADHEALEALESCVDALYQPNGLNAACAAYAHFRDGELQQEAIDRLAERVQRTDGARARAAVAALVSFSGAALGPLEWAIQRHEDPEVRHSAAGGLVGYLRAKHDPQSLRLLLDWYRPPRSGSRARGVAALASFSGPEHLKAFDAHLRGKHGDPISRTMVLEALASIDGEVARALIVRSLRSRSPAEQLVALELLDALQHDGYEQAVETLLRSKDPSLRHAAFLSLHRLLRTQPDWNERITVAAGGRDFALRAAAASVLPDHPEAEPLALLKESLADDHPVVRQAAIDALTRLRDRAAIPLLIDRLAFESLRLRASLQQALVSLTGLDHGDRPTRWRAWWQEQGDSFVLPPLDEALAAERQRELAREANPTQSLFYGIPLASDRLSFVLDISGSMSALVAGGREMRIDVLRRELVQALKGMVPQARFNLVFFSDHPDAWAKKLVDLNADSLEAATQFIERQGAGGGTALYDALMEAYEDESVDTIVLLSDGEPTSGRIVDANEIVADLWARNRLRRVVFHTVAVGGPSALLQSLSSMSGGNHRVAN